MLMFFEILLLLSVLAMVAYPLMGIRHSAKELVENELSDLLYKKDAAFFALKDLKFDHATGKIDDSDYDSMKQKFESEAVAVLDEIESFEKGIDTTDKTSPAQTETENKKFCTQCGEQLKGDFRFCPACGNKTK